MGYGYSNDIGVMEESMDMVGASAAGIFIAVILLFYLILFAFAIVSYVLQAIGMYTIAKRRGIRHPWLSWLPVGDVWILGSISDQYNYVAKGKIRNRRKTLLGLSIATCCMVIFMIVFWIAGVIRALGSTTSDISTGVAMGAFLGSSILVYFALIVLAIISAVLQYIALHDLYASCNPDNSTLYLVLSIIFGVTLPFFVFACRNKDLGMPPRKEPETLPDPDAAGPEDFV